MKLTKLKEQVDRLVSQNLGDLEVLDENRIALEQIFVDNKKGENAAIISHGQNPTDSRRID